MINECIRRYPMLEVCRKDMERAVDVLMESFGNGGQLLICGNGGSCADSGHIAGELLKGFYSLRPIPTEVKEDFKNRFGQEGENLAGKLQGSLPVISLPDQTAVLTAFNNDVDASMGYAQLVYGFARPKDVFLGISTSGNSKNIVNAARTAVVRGAKSIALVGERHCLLDEICDIVIHVPETITAYVQELHLPVYHALCAQIEKEMYCQNRVKCEDWGKLQ